MLNLRKYTTGWLGYYAIAEMKSAMLQLTGWIRRRIRQIYWKQWKRIWPKYKNLRQLGIHHRDAWRWANSRLGCWHIARTWILTTSLTNKYLASQGYDDILLRYEAMRARYRTAVYRTVRTVV